MKVLTVWQPWAGALAAGIKENETRSWATKYRGPIAIHSAMKAINHTWSNLYMNDEAREVICRRLELPEIINGPATFPMGCILATAELVDCIRITPEFVAALSADELVLGDYSLGRYARGSWQTSKSCRSLYRQRAGKGSGTGRVPAAEAQRTRQLGSPVCGDESGKLWKDVEPRTEVMQRFV